MRETFTQKRKSLLVIFSMLFLAVIGGKAYAEVADNEEAGATSVSITPAEGEVTSLKDFVVTFNGYDKAEWTLMKPVQIYKDGEVIETISDLDVIADNKLACSLSKEITAPGTYTLSIPKGAISFNKVMENVNNKMEFTYTIAPSIVSAVMASKESSVDLLSVDNLEKLVDGQNLVFKLNDENVKYAKIMFGEPGDNFVSWFNRQEIAADGSFVFPIARDFTLYADVNYPVTVFGYDNDPDNGNEDAIFEMTFYLQGSTYRYVYSSTTLVEPSELLYTQNEPNFTLESAEDNKISFTFSDAVKVKDAIVPLGMGASEDCAVEMSEDNKVATIVIPSSVLTSYTNFVVSLLVEGADGQIVKGNNGVDENSYISVYVDAKFNLPEVTMVDPAPDATVEKISTIKFGYDKGIAENSGKITILDKARNVVATSTSMSQVIPEEEADNWDYVPVEIEVIFDNEITANGVYTVVVPEGMFNVDLQSQGFEMKSNREAIFNITVDNGDTPSQAMHVSANPQEGEVGSLKDFEFTFMDYNSCAWTNDAMPYISDGDGNKLATISNVDYGTGWNQLVCSLNAEITEPGTYILTIPAGAVTYNDDPDNLNSEVTFTYTIADKSNENVSITPEAGNVTEIPELLILTFNDQTEVGASGNCTLVDEKGNSYKAQLGIYWEGELNQLQIELADGAITAEGTYTLTIPAGAVSYGSMGDTSNGELTFVFVIGNATAISNIFAAEGNVEIYNANGQLVKSGNASAIKSLAPNKMYIINGKKVIIK